jgi:DNA polymerase-3 subunit gamma/tau
LSRCQTFSFRKPTEAILADLVRTVSKKEKLAIDDESASLIALLGDGSFRDTLGILQKVATAATKRTITRELVEKVTGAPSLVLLRDLYTALIEKDIERAYQSLHTAVLHHTDMMLLAELLLDTMRRSLMYRYAPSLREKIEQEHSEEYVGIVKRGAVEGVDVISSRGVVAMITAIERIAYAAVPALPLELAFIEMTGAEEASEK